MVKRFFLSALSLSVLAAILLTPGVTAEQLDQLPRPSISATIISDPPTLDGDFLNDPAWSSVTPTGNFLQQSPDIGQPASQRTEVYFASTAQTGLQIVSNEPQEINGVTTAIPNRNLPIKYLFELLK